MDTSKLQARRRKGASVVLCLMIGFGISHAPAMAAGKSSVSYAPGVSLVPEVLLPDGATPRMYNTTNGLSLWTNTLPIVQGDKVKLNVFAATGGAELKEIIVRVDNTKIADLAAAPWKTSLDTTKLGPGHHMVEVWAQSTGAHPQATTQTLMFYVASELASQFIPQPATQKVAGSLQQQSGGQVSTLPLPGENSAAATNTPPTLEFLKGQTLDTNAQVMIYAHSAVAGLPNQAGAGTMVTGSTLTVSEPYLLSVKPAAGSSAVQFAYALVRGGQVDYASPTAFDTTRYQVRIEKLNSAGTGLGLGTVTLWVWGINRAGQPAEPTKTVLNIL